MFLLFLSLLGTPPVSLYIPASFPFITEDEFVFIALYRTCVVYSICVSRASNHASFAIFYTTYRTRIWLSRMSLSPLCHRLWLHLSLSCLNSLFHPSLLRTPPFSTMIVFIVLPEALAIGICDSAC